MTNIVTTCAVSSAQGAGGRGAASSPLPPPSPLGRGIGLPAGQAGVGGALRRLTRAPGSDLWPAWSSDGFQLAFVSERDANPEIYVVDMKSTRGKRMTHTQAEEKWVSWRP